MKSESPWLAALSETTFPRLDRNLRVEALIIGGGIAGVTAAYMLKAAGKSVALVERGTIGCGETGHTTAHIAYPTDMRLQKLVSTIGKSHAQAAWDAQEAAAQKIVQIISTEDIKADMRTVSGYLFAAFGSDEKEVESLQSEAQLASELGFDASFQKSCPGVGRPAIQFANQHKFHAGKYLAQLAQKIPGNGSFVFENSPVSSIEDNPQPLHAKCGDYTINCDAVFVATHVPKQGITSALSASIFQTKLAAYSTYAIQASLPPGMTPEALLWDTSEPYLYIRMDRAEDGSNSVIIGGEDHKTGQSDDTEACYSRLEKTLRERFPGARAERRWTGQVIETNDGLPYIGEIAKGQFIATGFSGTGMTWGTLAAIMFHDHMMGISNPWKDLVAVGRTGFLPSWNYLAENTDYPYYFAKSFFISTKDTIAQLKPGEGKVIKHNGKEAAAYCNEEGEVCMHSAVCPHMGCTVAWNNAEKTWDCPCHGSRFSADGEVMGGPAECGLKPLGEKVMLNEEKNKLKQAAKKSTKTETTAQAAK
ncbi:MAG TPA: FAD-dependent oxidoreductase [Candidatus Methylacidiphilales bacterium]|nr:FAD-dependent oxidoreductase [Candidatus Methylacidiphilales bacterium]